MLRKLNTTLLIIALVLAMILGAYTLYTKFGPSIENSNIVKELEG